MVLSATRKVPLTGSSAWSSGWWEVMQKVTPFAWYILTRSYSTASACASIVISGSSSNTSAGSSGKGQQQR